MKRTKFLAIVLVIAVVLMGAGYAYWQEELTITSTVKTGNLNIIFESFSESESPRGENYIEVSVEPINDGKQLNFIIDKMYPGSGGHMSFKIRNTGTVPAKLKAIQPQMVQNDENVADVLKYTVDRITLYRRGILGEYEQTPILQVPIVKENFDDFVNALEERLQTEPPHVGNGFQSRDLVLEPGGYLEIRAAETGYNIAMPWQVDDDKYEDATLIFNLGLVFEQCE